MDFKVTFDAVTEKVSGWIDQLVLMLPNLAAAIAIVVLFWFLAKWGKSLVKKLTGRVTDHQQIQDLLSTVASLALLLSGLFIALGLLQLDKTVTSLLAGVGILGLALGFAFQDLAANFMAGIIMAFRRPFRIGDLVETNGAFGRVKEVSLRSTVVTTLQGLYIEIPNKDVLGNPITNYTNTPDRRVDLSVGVAYGDDLDKAEAVAVEAVRSVPRDEERDVELFYESFGDSSINFTLRFWLKEADQKAFLAARSEAIKKIKSAFDEHEITIPFPIRTLDFGVVGGQRLAEALPWKEMGRDSSGTS